MNVIGHNYPGNQFVSLTIKVSECVLHSFGNSCVFQEAAAVTRIEI